MGCFLVDVIVNLREISSKKTSSLLLNRLWDYPILLAAPEKGSSVQRDQVISKLGMQPIVSGRTLSLKETKNSTGNFVNYVTF